MRGLLWIDPSLPLTACEQLAERVGGVRLVERQLRLLRAAGATELAVVGLPGAEAVVRAAIDPGGLAFVWFSESRNGEAASSDAPLWAQWLAGKGGFVLRAEALFERRVFAPLRQQAQSQGVFTIAQAEDGHERGLGWLPAGHVGPLTRWLLHSEDGNTRPASYVLGAGDWVGEAVDPASRVRAETLLWEGCRKPLDGVVSRHFNRHISLAISRRIAHRAISPNQISVFNVVLGVLAALLAARGSYAMVLMGAVLLQINSILDGVDGELARMRIQSSVLGEWLDTISDDVSNQGFFAGLAWGAHSATGSAIWVWLGLLTVVPMVATSAYYYRLLIAKGRGDLLVIDWFKPKPRLAGPPSLMGRAVATVEAMLRRDAFVALLAVAAALGLAPYALFGTAPAAVGLLASVIVRRPAA